MKLGKKTKDIILMGVSISLGVPAILFGGIFGARSIELGDNFYDDHANTSFWSGFPITTTEISKYFDSNNIYLEDKTLILPDFYDKGIKYSDFGGDGEVDKIELSKGNQHSILTREEHLSKYPDLFAKGEKRLAEERTKIANLQPRNCLDKLVREFR